MEVMSNELETMDIPVENELDQIIKERKLTSCNNSRNRRTGIMRGGGI